MPQLGTHKDHVLRHYVERELTKEALHTKLLFISNLPLKQEGINSLLKEYQRWVTLHFLMEEGELQDDTKLKEDFMGIMALQPKLIVNKDGSYAVSGLTEAPGKAVKRTTRR